MSSLERSRSRVYTRDEVEAILELKINEAVGKNKNNELIWDPSITEVSVRGIQVIVVFLLNPIYIS